MSKADSRQNNYLPMSTALSKVVVKYNFYKTYPKYIILNQC